MTKMCIRSQLSLSLKIKLQAVESHLISLIGICISKTLCVIRYLNLSFRNGNKDHASLLIHWHEQGRKKSPIFLIQQDLPLCKCERLHLSVRALAHRSFNLPSSQLQLKALYMCNSSFRIKERMHFSCSICNILQEVLEVCRVKSKKEQA